jgi:hypothetical protein
MQHGCHDLHAGFHTSLIFILKSLLWPRQDEKKKSNCSDITVDLKFPDLLIISP